MDEELTAAELEAYLDESLPVQRAARVEEAMRADRALVEQLGTLAGQRDAGLVECAGERAGCSALRADQSRRHVVEFERGEFARRVNDLQRPPLETGRHRCHGKQRDPFIAARTGWSRPTGAFKVLRITAVGAMNNTNDAK